MEAALRAQQEALQSALELNRWLTAGLSREAKESGAAPLLGGSQPAQDVDRLFSSPSARFDGADERIVGDAADLTTPLLGEGPPGFVDPPDASDASPPMQVQAVVSAKTRVRPEIDRPLATHGHERDRLPEVSRVGTVKKSETQVFATHEEFKRGLAKAIHSSNREFGDLATGSPWACRLSENGVFQDVTIAMIVLNVFWIAIDTDFNKADILCDAAPVFQIVNNIFTTFFFFEVIVRMYAAESFCTAFSSRGFLFDFVLVVLMVWETWIQVMLYLASGWPSSTSTATGGSLVLGVFRVFRITRVARLGRLLKIIPELLVLVKGLTIAMRSVFATLLLLVMAIYVFSLTFTMLLSGTLLGSDVFGSVIDSMHFLLLQVVCGFDTTVVARMLEAGWLYFALFLLFYFSASLTILNMLIGVICNVVNEVAEVENEAIVSAQLDSAIQHMYSHLDVDGNLPPEKFAGLMEDENVVVRLQEAGIDVKSFVELACHAYRDHDALDADQLKDIIGGFHGCKYPTLSDFITLRIFMSDELAALETRLCRDMRIEVSKSMPLEALRNSMQVEPIRKVDRRNTIGYRKELSGSGAASGSSAEL